MACRMCVLVALWSVQHLPPSFAIATAAASTACVVASPLASCCLLHPPYNVNLHPAPSRFIHTTVSSHQAAHSPPSTAGGKRATRDNKKKPKGPSSKIRAGSPQEEAQLVQHVIKQAPGAVLLEEAGQLAELLVMLGHLADARLLQTRLAAWAALHQEVVQQLAAQQEQEQQQGVQQARGPAGGKAAAGGAGVDVAAAAAAGAAVPNWKWDILRPAAK